MTVEQSNRLHDIMRSMMSPSERRADNLALQARLIARLGELQAELKKIPESTATASVDKAPTLSIEQRLSALEQQRQSPVYGPFPGPLIAKGFFLPK